MELLWRYHPEPTLSFDGDAAGQRAADRVIDRALPLLRAGKSFKFAFVKGGKDPDDVLREQGAPALRAQLASTVPFVVRLFEREANAEPLDTPERRAGFKARLRQLASAIGDRDLAEQYRSELFDRFYSKFQRRAFTREAGKLDFVEGLKGLVDKSLVARLGHRIRQFNAAIAVAAIEHPDWVRRYDEQFERYGFGDKNLALLVQPILDAIQEDHFDRDLVILNVRGDGASAQLDKARVTAIESGVYPFLTSNVDVHKARKIWERCFEVLLAFAEIEEERRERKAALERREAVLDKAKLFERGQWLQTQQRTLGSLISGGSLWLGEDGAPVLPH